MNENKKTKCYVSGGASNKQNYITLLVNTILVERYKNGIIEIDELFSDSQVRRIKRFCGHSQLHFTHNLKIGFSN